MKDQAPLCVFAPRFKWVEGEGPGGFVRVCVQCGTEAIEQQPAAPGVPVKMGDTYVLLCPKGCPE